MADDYSFDVVSEVDLQAIDDGVNTGNKEIGVRFDFRGSASRMEFNKDKKEIILYSDDEGKLKNVVEIFKNRMAKRGVDLKTFEFGKSENSLGGKAKQLVKVTEGITTEKAKAIVADIKKKKFKATPSIQGNKVRVSSKSKNVLQEIISLLKGNDYGIPLQFSNFR